MEPKETETNIYQEFAITSTHDVFYKTQEQSLKCFQKRNLQNEQGMKAEKETFPFNFNIRWHSTGFGSEQLVHVKGDSRVLSTVQRNGNWF